jgi:hypothetical protein
MADVDDHETCSFSSYWCEVSIMFKFSNELFYLD